MPVPSLPLELNNLILRELRLSCGDDDAARRSIGLAAALVCKAWQPLGVGVVWYSVRLDSPSRTRRLSESAEHFPHFPPLIKKAYLVPTPSDAAAGRGETGSGPDKDRLGEFLSLCTLLDLLIWWLLSHPKPQEHSADTSHFYLDLFDHLDTHTLRDMTLMLHPGNLAVIDRLFRGSTATGSTGKVSGSAGAG
ncbi:hypothetical protein JCM10207_006391 [Rhodosporidiobolus poonsookiae]